jgi:serine-aspartate repeat-containing protein C/D/E
MASSSASVADTSGQAASYADSALADTTASWWYANTSADSKANTYATADADPYANTAAYPNSNSDSATNADSDAKADPDSSSNPDSPSWQTDSHAVASQ